MKDRKKSGREKKNFSFNYIMQKGVIFIDIERTVCWWKWFYWNKRYICQKFIVNLIERGFLLSMGDIALYVVCHANEKNEKLNLLINRWFRCTFRPVDRIPPSHDGTYIGVQLSQTMSFHMKLLQPYQTHWMSLYCTY